MDTNCKKSQVQQETISTKNCPVNKYRKLNVHNLTLMQEEVLTSVLSKFFPLSLSLHASGGSEGKESALQWGRP